MLIRRINSVFQRHGRWLFGLVTILIIVSFLGFLSPGFTGMFSGTGSSRTSTVGEAFGQSITIEDLRTQTTRSMIIFSLLYNRPVSDRMIEQAASQNAFQAAIRLRAAKHRGIIISDEEVADYIASEKNFQKDGKFDITLFDKFIDEQLKPLQLSPADLDESVRDFLAQNALERIVTENIVITPDEIDNFNKMLNQKIELSVANLKAENYAKEVKITDEELTNYFKTNESKYQIPERYKALLAVFSFEKVEPLDEDLKKYYETVKSKYFKDGKEQPFEAVKKELSSEYSQKIAREKTIRKGQLFANVVYEKTNAQTTAEQRKTFVQLAAGEKLRIIETDWFAADATAIGKLNEPAIIKEFVEISGIVTNAVPGKDGIYVGFLTDKEPSRQATFVEVKEQVKSELTNLKALDLARQNARDIVKKLAQSESKVAETVKNDPLFAAIPAYTMMAPPQIPDSNYILQQTDKLSPNGFSPAVDTTTGALVVVMLKRSMPDNKELEEKRQIAEYILKQQKSNAAFSAFNAWLQANTKEYRNQ